MSPSDRTWQALEFVVDEQAPRPSYATPIHKSLAKVVYEAVSAYDCGPVTSLSIPGVTRQRTLLRASTSPASPPSLPDFPPIDTAEITDATKILAALAYPACSDHVGLGIVTVDTEPIGQTSAHTQRLLANASTPSTTLSTTSPPFEELLAATSSRPHALSVVVDRGTDDRIELSIRFVDFSPDAQVSTRDALARIRENSPVSISDYVDWYMAMTNWDLPEENGWEWCSERRLPGESRELLRKKFSTCRTDWAANRALSLALSNREYHQVFKRSPADVLAGAYTSLGMTGQFTPEAEQLPAFYPVTSRSYSQSVWQPIPARAPVRITLVEPVYLPESMSVVNTDPTETARKYRPTTEGDEYSAFETAVRRWCLERGEHIRNSECTIAAVPFERVTTDETRMLAYLSEESPHPGTLIAATWHAHHDPTLDGVTVFTVSKSSATKAIETLLQPFKGQLDSTTVPKTELYRTTTALRSESKIAVRPVDTPAEQWALTPDNELQCLINDTVVSGSLAEPLETFLVTLPYVSYIDETIMLTQPAKGETTPFESPEAVQAVTTPIQQPARPAHLATGLETATVFYQDGLNFKQHRITASWDREQRLVREDAAATIFLNQYTVGVPDATLPTAAAIPEFVSFLRHQTDEPLSSSLKIALADVHGDDTDVLQDRTWRYTIN